MKQLLLLAAFAAAGAAAQDLALRDEMLHAAALPVKDSPVAAGMLRDAGLRAADGPWYRDCRVWSTLSLLAAHAVDTASSWNGVEANPVLGAGSRFGVRGTAIKFSFAGGYMVFQQFVLRRAPASKRVWCAANYAGAAAIGAVAARNFTVPR